MQKPSFARVVLEAALKEVLEACHEQKSSGKPYQSLFEEANRLRKRLLEEVKKEVNDKD